MAAKKKLRVAGYLRRSTKKQEASIKDQKEACIAYVERSDTELAKLYDIEIVCWYQDDGISGDDTANRAGFLQMRDDASTGEFNAVLCWDQDRFGRFDSIEAGHWIYPFRIAGVVLITTNEGMIDWEDYMGRVMYSLKQEAAHDHNVKLSKNVLRGQIEAAKKGSWIGSAPYAYRIEGPKGTKKIVPGDQEHIAIVKQIFREYVNNEYSLSHIAKRLNAKGIPSPGGSKWGGDSVKWILQNPVYIGTFRANVSSRGRYHNYSDGTIQVGAKHGRRDPCDWIVIPAHHKAIVTAVIFAQAADLLAKGKTGQRPYTSENNPYLLSRLVRCGHCGKTMVGVRGGKGRSIRYYECHARNRNFNGCPGTTVKEIDVLDKLSEYVEMNYIFGDDNRELFEKAKAGKLTKQDVPEAYKRLSAVLFGKQTQQANPKATQKQIKALERKVADWRDKLLDLKKANIPAAEARIERAETEIGEMKRELAAAPRELDINAVVMHTLRELYLLAQLKPDKMKPVIRAVESITVHTKVSGTGGSRRHKFVQADVKMRVQIPPGKSNPHRAD